MAFRAGTVFHGTVGQPTAQVINGSLKFEKTASNYLSRTFSAGNRKTFTVSFWHKHSNHSEGASVGAGGGKIFSTGTVGSGARGEFGFAGVTNGSNEDKVSIGFNATGSTWKSLTSDAFFRDFAAWQHFVIAVDVAQSNASDRVRFYVNGVQQALSGSFPLDENQQFNNNVGHAIGRYNPEGTDYYNGLLSNFYLIDGSALAAGYFGFTDPLTGTWRPKKLRQGDPTVNDGTQWSSYITNSTGASNLFDGDLSTTYGPDGNTQTWTPPKPIEVISQLRIYYSSGVASRNFEVNDNGNVVATGTGTKWVDLNFTGSLRKLSGTNGWNVRAIEIDGVILVDSTTTTVNFGTNGFYLPMDNEDDFEIDKSGKGNNWTKNGFSGTSVDPDVIKDSPSGAVFGGRGRTGITTTSSAPSNYCTLNPIDAFVSTKDGNLETATSSGWQGIRATLGMKSGKFYWETQNNQTAAAILGIADTQATGFVDGAIFGSTGHGGGDANPAWTWAGANYYFNATSAASGSLANHTSSDIVQYAFDADSGNLWFGRNGTWYSSSWATTGDPANGVNPTVSGIDTTKTYVACGSFYNGSAKFNFGQKPFKYAPPQGFLPLNSASARPNTVVPRPKDYVGVATYDGSGNTFQEMNVGFKPDFVWCKSITNAENHALFDSVRGSTKFLRSDSTDNQYTISNVDFTLKGFSFANGSGEICESGQSYVGLAWRAGGAPTADNTQTSGAMTANSVSVDGVLQSAYTPSGSPSTYPKRMSVGTDQGFSIVQFVGNASNRTLPHGLGKSPKFMIVKNMDTDATGWSVYHDAIGTATDNYIELQVTTAASASDNAFQKTAPTSDVFSIGTKAATNNDTDDTIAYIWADVPGMQKFGQFAGNNSADGVFVELGFRPAILLIKNDNSTGDWIIWDNERNKTNPVNRQIWPYTGSGTYGAYDQVGANYPLDFLSNGFKMRTTDADMNGSSRTYIYAAWAEAPASNLFGGQSTGR